MQGKTVWPALQWSHRITSGLARLEQQSHTHTQCMEALRTSLLSLMGVHQVLDSAEVPSQLCAAHAVLLGTALVSCRNYEHNVARLVSSLMQVSLQEAVLAPLSYKLHVRRFAWVNRWNRKGRQPFYLRSCAFATELGSGGAGRHDRILQSALLLLCV